MHIFYHHEYNLFVCIRNSNIAFKNSHEIPGVEICLFKQTFH